MRDDSGMPSALVGPLRWLSAIVVLAVLVYVVAPLALDAFRSSIRFGEPGSGPTGDAGAAEGTEPEDEAQPDGRQGRRNRQQRQQGQQQETQGAEGTPSPAPAETAASDGEVYTVQGGDTLADIAAEFYGESELWPVIQEANDLESTALVVGQELEIPPNPEEP